MAKKKKSAKKSGKKNASVKRIKKSAKPKKAASKAKSKKSASRKNSSKKTANKKSSSKKSAGKPKSSVKAKKAAAKPKPKPKAKASAPKGNKTGGGASSKQADTKPATPYSEIIVEETTEIRGVPEGNESPFTEDERSWPENLNEEKDEFTDADEPATDEEDEGSPLDE